MRLTSGYGPGKPNVYHAADLPPEERRARHGWGHFQPPERLVAGEHATLTFEFEIGREQIPEGGRVALFWRWPFDWSDLQTEDPAGAGYVTVSVTVRNGGAVGLATSYHPYSGMEPYHHHLDVQLRSGRLEEGDRVRVVCGDTSGGGPGWRAPTCAAREVEFLMLVDPAGDAQWTRLAGPEPFAVHPGPAERLVAIAPSEVVVGETQRIIARAEDRWGNATATESAAQLELPEGATLVERRTLDRPPACHFDVAFSRPGTYRLECAVPGTALSARTNPVRVLAERPRRRVFWGDLHSGQTLIGCGAGTLAEHYAFGRDAAGLQFLTHQANDHYVTVDDWEETRRVTKEFQEPGRYLAILGCEWSPPTKDGGDRNVFYRHDEPRLLRSARFFTETDPDDAPDIPTAPEFHEAYRDQDVLVNIHVGGRMTNLEWYDPRIERLAETHSTHGTVEWFFRDCLARGYRVAATAGTDGVMGRPGADHPGWRLIRNVRGGLTAVCAEELTMDAVWEALRARRTYATTGERIALEVDVDGHAMGEEFETAGEPLIRLRAEGTAALERVDLLRGTQVIGTWQVARPHPPEDNLFRVLWGGTEKRGTARVQRVTWDGSLEVEGGSLELVGDVGFQSPMDAAEQVSQREVRWSSATAGNDAGIVLKMAGDEETVCRFRSGPARFEFGPAQVRLAPMTVDAGGLDRRVSIGPAPREDGTRRVELSWRDAEPAEGLCPYWVRVVQVDQEKAWSSPVYVTRTRA